MATFSVDITSVRFAATNTGYKDITITGMPQAGVDCTITGTNASSFGYRIPGDDQNVYRVYTTSHSNIGTNAAQKTATFKITNSGDSTDYVEVSLVQCAYYGKPAVMGVENVYDNIYAYYQGDSFASAYVFAEYRTDNVGTYAILYVDGYEGTTTLSESWAYYTAESAYSDTGFKQIKVGATNNYDAECKSCTITFPGTGGTLNSSVLYQNPYPSSTSGCTSPISFSGSGGTERITLKTDQQPASNIDYYDYSNDGLTYTIVESGSGTLYYDVTVGANQSDNVLKGAILFERGSTYKKYGFALVKQDPSSGPVPTLTVDPEVLTYPASGGARVLDVTYTGTLTTSTFPAWLTYQTVQVDTTHRSYTITASSNSSTSSRSFNLELSNGIDTVTVPITQAGVDAPSLTISPTGDQVGSASGSVQITVTTTGGISEVNFLISDDWITIYSNVGNVYTFNYTANSTSSNRTGTVTFYGGGLSATYTLTQEAGSISVSPASSTVNSTSGTVQVTVTGVSNITYSISGYWLTYQSKSGNVYTFAYTQNSTTSQRTATVTFSASGVADSIFTLTQEGESVISDMVVSPLKIVRGGGRFPQGYINVRYRIDYASGHSYNDITASTGVSWLTRDASGDTDYTTYGIFCFALSQNNSGSDRYSTIEFSDGDNVVSAQLKQSKTFSDSPFELWPDSLTFSANGSTQYVAVEGLTEGYSSIITPSWISYDWLYSEAFIHSEAMNITASPNTGEERTGYIDFYWEEGGTLAGRMLVSQAGSAGISVSPNYNNVDFQSGTVQVTVTGPSSITYSISGSWLTYQSKSGNVYTFAYTQNDSTLERRATVTFSASGFAPVTFTLIQAGRSASFSIIPSSLTFHKEEGSDNLTFFNIPNGGLSWNITYGSGTDWISSISFNNNVATVSVSENTGSRRNAVIRFYNQDDDEDYLDLIIVQNGEGFDSIWFDKAFEPSSFQVGESYHYKLQDHNTNNIIYEGITVPVSDTENPLGINIPRLVDSYIHSNILDDLKEDMILRKLDGSLSVDFYDMNGSTPSQVKTFNYWNDWSGPGYNTVYDITQALNDPINHKGCNYMVIPFCIYDDELSSYTVVETKKDGTQVNYPMGTPSDAFMYAAGEFFNAKSVSFKKGNDTLLTYDMDNCGEGFILYKNRFGGWDSFLIEGNIYKYDEYTRLNGVYPKYPNGYGYSREKMTDRNTIRTRYEINTGWLTDEQAERLVFHLMSSTTVALRSFSDRTVSSFPYNMLSVSIVDSSAEYKKFKNGKRLINYTITLEENDTKQVQR